MPLPSAKHYTIDDIYSLPQGTRAELIDGQIFYMAPPSRKHQQIVGDMYFTIRQYIIDNNGDCEVYVSPFAVFLDADNDDTQKYVEPDVAVICDKNKLDDKGCHGAPDWIIEVVSPSSRRMDYSKKVSEYLDAGVKEYWIVDPMRQTVFVYCSDDDWVPVLYHFSDKVPVRIYPGLSIDFTKFANV